MPMFKDFSTENEALAAVKRMKQKFSEEFVGVISPLPAKKHELSADDYGLPKKNVIFTKQKGNYQLKLLNWGFTETQILALEEVFKKGHLIVVIKEKNLKRN